MAIVVGLSRAPAHRQSWPFEALRLALVLGKARVVGLVTFTAMVGAVLGARGHPTTESLLLVLGIGILAGGGAGALNHVLDRDLDARMSRTASRPLVVGRVSAWPVAAGGTLALICGVGLAAFGGAGVLLNVVVAGITYVLVYTRLLKRHTPQSVIIGGWTGAAAVLAGWETSHQPLSAAALALAAVVFLWTPAHFWSLALVRLEEYRSAGVPALPVVAGVHFTVLAVAVSAVVTLAAASVPLLTGDLGAIYAAALLLATIAWGYPIARLLCERTRRAALQTFVWSNLGLLLVFTAALVDAAVRAM